MKRILLNADVGEEAGFDEQIMPFISWCNIACGVHAGNDEVIKKTIELALQHHVKIGAHPSYPDRENFGRSVMDISPNDLSETLMYQIQKVKSFTEEQGGKLHHVKPHGALYNEAMKNEVVAKSIIQSIINIDKSLLLISPKDSMISYLCRGFIDVRFEVFADRNYNSDLTLVSRSEKNAVLVNPKKIVDHILRMIVEGKVKTIKGEELSIFFDTICVHGDNPKSVEILAYIYEEFTKRNFVLK
ncbi:5-oxoprolinase subunit PxpA [Aquimarina sp. 2201CG14-23]|uniref:5-oxoprolinase subunit PxpA n=1 Tax=Aquimarina mycalae TaxID=3040073 RepID=UPI002477D7FE|nr:5-oxoprolinase subunit PxpA [Aquimarina sp. 2201CG14-23]MDH7444121.1 5-oxoprolinase subunit PxpA [Aquimarina sp. 2201CG14-23]